MKAVRVVGYHQNFQLADVPEPEITSPLDVIVAVTAAGVCRTDIHIQEGQWADKSNVQLPYTVGHENAGVIHKVGDAVKHLQPGEKVILHPIVTCGLCRACRSGDDVHCTDSLFPGVNCDGGYAEYLKTTARSVIKLDQSLEPADVAALADAGLTAYHTVKKVAPTLRPGNVVVCIGAGGLGHIGIQCLRALNNSIVLVVVDRNSEALALAKKLGADHIVQATDDGKFVDEVLKLTGGHGAEAIIDFVAESGSTKTGVKMLRRAGSYYVVGYGENLDIPTIDIISTEINFIGNLVGSYNDLEDLMVLAAQGKVTLHTTKYKLHEFQKAMDDLSAGKVRGRAILVPSYINASQPQIQSSTSQPPPPHFRHKRRPNSAIDASLVAPTTTAQDDPLVRMTPVLFTLLYLFFPAHSTLLNIHEDQTSTAQPRCHPALSLPVQVRLRPLQPANKALGYCAKSAQPTHGFVPHPPPSYAMIAANDGKRQQLSTSTFSFIFMASMNSGTQRGPARGRGGRQNTRGGIQKHGQGPRVDRDGDLNMDGPARGRGGPRSRRSRSPSVNQTRGGGNSNSNSNNNRDDTRRSSRPGRNPFATVKRALNQQDGPAKQSGAARFAAAMEQASKGFSNSNPAAKSTTSSQLARITIKGWSKSKAATNPNVQQQLVDFLERKSSHREQNVRISKSHINGDTLTISVEPDYVSHVLHLDGYEFAGAPLSIREKTGPRAAKDSKPAEKKAGLSDASVELKDRMKSMLERRYNAENKLLDLSSIGTDPEFAGSAIFDSASTQSKFFPALMKVAGDAAPTAQQKRDMIVSVTLSNNNLPDVATVTSLAQTFPDIKNLDLSNNNLRNLKALEPWQRRFRSLELLILSGNPIETQEPNYAEEVVRWYPSLRTLNGIQVRTDEQVAAASNGKLVIPIARPCFQDESAIGENFLKFFFPAFDGDRASLVNSFYDANATFSHSINTSAKRVEDKTPEWSQYIKSSRNMLKITSFGGRKARISRGTEQVRQAWERLPATRHPDLATESNKWCIECHPLGGLPDPKAANGGMGVGGLIIYVHGEFGEVDVASMDVRARRSFDRTFVLGPGDGLGGIRVISDMLIVRAYGGIEAFAPTGDHITTTTHPAGVANMPNPYPGLDRPLAVPPDPQPTQAPGPVALAVPTNAEIPAGLAVPPGFAQPAPDKPQEQLQKELIALELSRRTRLTLDYARMCLEQNDWNVEMASVAFQEARAGLGPEAFF